MGEVIDCTNNEDKVQRLNMLLRQYDEGIDRLNQLINHMINEPVMYYDEEKAEFVPLWG